MKHIKSIFAAALFLIMANIVTAQTKMEWKEKEEFHKVMSETFHPMEEGNYKPIRERSGELAEKATAWKTAAIPVEFKNTKEIKKNIKQLVKKSKALDKKIKANCTNETIKEELIKMHDIFHDIAGLCKTTDH